MIKQLLLLFLFLVGFSPFFVTSEIEWIHEYGGSEADYIYRIIENMQGGITAIGDTRSRSNGGKDVYLLMLDENGALIKEKPIGGQRYNWVRLKDGNKWLAKNFNYKTADSWCYDKNENNCSKYGRLYTWEAAKKGSEQAYYYYFFQPGSDLRRNSVDKNSGFSCRCIQD